MGRPDSRLTVVIGQNHRIAIVNRAVLELLPDPACQRDLLLRMAVAAGEKLFDAEVSVHAVWLNDRKLSLRGRWRGPCVAGARRWPDPLGGLGASSLPKRQQTRQPGAVCWSSGVIREAFDRREYLNAKFAGILAMQNYLRDYAATIAIG